MKRDRTWRALAPSERVQAGKEAYIGYAVHATGRLHLDALTTAYDAVCRAYPQLMARIDTGDDGLVFAASDTRPEVHTCDGDLERPLAGVQLDQHQMLSALNVVHDGEATSICLLTHHSIADAQHSLEVLAAVLSCYTDVVGGVPVDVPCRPFPRSLEDLLAERGIGRGTADDGWAPQPSMVPGQPAVRGQNTRGQDTRGQDAPARHVVQHRMTAAQTSALADIGHREKVTVNGLSAGVLLLVEAEVRDLPLTELIYRSTVNLRRHLTPPVGPTEGTNVIGAMGFTANDDIARDAVTIGRAISARVRAGLADGSIQRSLLDLLSRPTPDSKPWDPSTAPAVVSMMNWGRVPPMRTPNDLRLTNFRSASSMREMTTMGGYVVNTFGSRIGIDLAWPENDSELPRRIECLRDRLQRLTLRS